MFRLRIILFQRYSEFNRVRHPPAPIFINLYAGRSALRSSPPASKCHDSYAFTATRDRWWGNMASVSIARLEGLSNRAELVGGQGSGFAGAHRLLLNPGLLRAFSQWAAAIIPRFRMDHHAALSPAVPKSIPPHPADLLAITSS